MYVMCEGNIDECILLDLGGQWFSVTMVIVILKGSESAIHE